MKRRAVIFLLVIYSSQCSTSYSGGHLFSGYGETSEDCGDRYILAKSTPDTFEAAKALCSEFAIGAHLLFLETPEENSFWQSKDTYGRMLWLGLQKFESNWYWTFHNGSKFQATYTPWKDPPGSGQAAVFTGDEKWESEDMSKTNHVVCELNHCDDGKAATVAAYEGDSFPAISTQMPTPSTEFLLKGAAPANPSTVQPNRLCDTESRPSHLVNRNYILQKISAGKWSYANLPVARSLLDCVSHCLDTEQCCLLQYDPRNHSCYWLKENTVPGESHLDCARIDQSCYTVSCINA